MKSIILYFESHIAIIGVILVIVLVSAIPLKFAHHLVSRFGERTSTLFRYAFWIFILTAIILVVLQLFRPSFFSSLFPFVPILIGIGAAYRAIAGRLHCSNSTENREKKLDT